jgi:hypothetical protein
MGTGPQQTINEFSLPQVSAEPMMKALVRIAFREESKDSLKELITVQKTSKIKLSVL